MDASVERVEEMINDVIDARDYGTDLTPWESDFIDSVATQFEESNKISDKQFRILEILWEKVL